ncbi:outer membrane autotransporter barrel domain protein [Chondromyces apiculatus DSM 436]|uniref:Outer membrane autotransporter barrel domain protein n=2 Tax=Chondromyces apiculatus TaxID=51 RepID=A0A017SUB2_9BACT|nr:outer membrane autotransporter barrel domain protein [Chondromyces apiculatus DSM 436]
MTLGQVVRRGAEEIMIEKKRRALQAPFVVTVAAASALLVPLVPGCGASASGQCSGGECTPQGPPTEEGCPAKPPAGGAPCVGAGQYCSYPRETSCPEVGARCEADGTWHVMDFRGQSCNPPPPPPPSNPPPPPPPPSNPPPLIHDNPPALRLPPDNPPPPPG